ncbi:discoidin domain-containing protein [Cellulomonas sp. NPDC089187]|uniref:discoidin domain-containing protein n=1 Tax=Cellulomonas sp. NPDC089187 TaxID=3154970 RepID=UPI00341D4AAA
MGATGATPPSGDPGRAQDAAEPGRRWGAVTGAVLLTAVLLIGTGAVRWSGSDPGDGATVVEPPPAGEFTAPVCGVADPDRYAALATDSPVARVEALVPDLARDTGWGDDVPLALAAVGGRVATLGGEEGARMVARWTAAGAPLTTAQVGAAGSFALTEDGTVLAPVGSDTVGAWPVDEADPTATWQLPGEVTAVVGWSAGTDALAAVVLADTDRVVLLRADGTVDTGGPELDLGWYPRFFPLDDGGLAVLSDADERSTSITLTRYAPDGTPGLTITGPLSTESTNGRAAALDHPTGVVTAPDGGLLLSGPTWRLLEVDEDGVWWRIALSGQGQGSTFTLADLSPMVRDDAGLLFVSPTDDGWQLSQVADDQVDLLLDAPLVWDLNHSASTDRLGFGLGLSTPAVDDYFPDGMPPVVTVDVDPEWGRLAGEYRLRYRVSGDPTLAAAATPAAGAGAGYEAGAGTTLIEPATAPTEPGSGPAPATADPGTTPAPAAELGTEDVTGTVDLPAGGGSVPLDLPTARPGGYEVHAELIDADGTVRTATCLRYAVGAPGAALDPAGLADGADWGGPGPLRGVQLADQLGIGSHRVQLDFGALVSDPSGPASAEHLDLSALPGATEDDPLSGLVAAASAATASGVQLIIQVGQGGEAEHAAVVAGTWGDWVAVIVRALRAAAPELGLWAPWNEPNNTGFGDGGDYARQVLAPFAAGVRTADPASRVVGGNALNVVVDWYRQLIEAGGCADLDVIGIHPYTGFNRSWQEEGTQGPLGQIAELRTALAAEPECAGLSIWGTESGWWSDGPANTWQQAADVARTRLLMTTLGVDEWTYFFSEGGWGEGGFSWSLIQVGAFVKPAALAMSTVDRMLAGRGAPEAVDTGDGAVTALAYPGLLALWTADAHTTVTVTTDRPTSATLIDVYGGSRALDLGPAGTDLPVSGSPTYLSTEATVTVSTAQPLLAPVNLLTGGTVTASSGDDPTVLVSADGAQAEPWQAGARTAQGPDVTPWVQVELAAPTELRRVTVVSAGIRCCTAGVRSYRVEVRTPEGDWQEVGGVSGAFWDRITAVDFAPVTATAIRVRVPSTVLRGVTVPDLVYSGQYGGLLPAWEPVSPTPTWPLALLQLSAT